MYAGSSVLRAAAGPAPFRIESMGTVPVWSSACRARSGLNLGISGASPWTLQAMVSTSITTDGYRNAVQLGADGASVGAFFGTSNLPSQGCRWNWHEYSSPFGTQSRVTPVANQWTLVTETYDGAVLRGYLNGSLVASLPVVLNITNGTLVICGNRAASNFFWVGAMARIGVWKRALSLAEIQATAANPAQAETQGPFIFYRCNEGAGTTLVDYGSAGDNGTISGTPSWASAVSAGAQWYPDITEFMCVGDSITAGTAGVPGSYRKTMWPTFTRPVSSVGIETAVSDFASAFSYFNEGVSGNTIQQANDRTVGVWGNQTAFLIGAPGCPTPGNRGQVETLAAFPVGEGNGGSRGMFFLSLLGTNDALAGAVNLTFYEVFLKRLWNVQGVTGTRRQIGVGTLLPILGNPAAMARVDTANAGIRPMVANLNAAGYPAVVVPFDEGFDPYTMLQGDGIHPNSSGYTHMGAVARPFIEG